MGSLISCDFEGSLDIKCFRSECLGVLDRVADVDVVEENILGHGPEFDTNTTLNRYEKWHKVREIMRTMGFKLLTGVRSWK